MGLHCSKQQSSNREMHESEDDEAEDDDNDAGDVVDNSHCILLPLFVPAWRVAGPSIHRLGTVLIG